VKEKKTQEGKIEGANFNTNSPMISSKRRITDFSLFKN
jgi:hypothetical protein